MLEVTCSEVAAAGELAIGAAAARVVIASLVDAVLVQPAVGREAALLAPARTARVARAAASAARRARTGAVEVLAAEAVKYQTVARHSP